MYLHWSAKYIGIPFKKGGRELGGLDCWGLLWYVYAQEFGIGLPTLPGITAQSALLDPIKISQIINEDWFVCELPFDGCAVAMSQEPTGELHHVGLYAGADGGKVVHAYGPYCVIADSIKTLRLKGFRTVLFYRHRLWPT